VPSFIARALILFEIYRGRGEAFCAPLPRLRNSKKAQAE